MSFVKQIRSELKLKPGQKLSALDRTLLETARILDEMDRKDARRRSDRKLDRLLKTPSRKRPNRKRR